MNAPLTIAVAKDVASLFNGHPGQWGYEPALGGEPFRVRHESGLTVWVANSAYGVHVSAGRDKRGGVTFRSSFGLSPAHWIVWLAYLRWRRAHPFVPTVDATAVSRTLDVALGRSVRGAA